MRMKRTRAGVSVVLAISLLLTACGNGSQEQASNQTVNGNGAAGRSAQASTDGQKTGEAAATKTITYLDKEYTLPATTERIVMAGAVEAMEDAIVLGVNPVGAISFSGVFPPMFESITKNAVSIGEKTEPNFEAILGLKPDVILGSTKFKPEVSEKLESIAPTILYSHVSTNWESNLLLLGELAGKKKQAEDVIAQYKADLEDAKVKLADKLKDKKVVVIRVREGLMYVYPAGVYFNPILYHELGLQAPAEIQAAKAQEALPIEKFAEMNPDYVFLQFAAEENHDAPNALEEWKNNPIIKSSNAVKNGKVYINIVDPLAQGGTAYSKIAFLKAAVEQLSE